MHCTLINTVCRNPRSKKRVPFLYGQIIWSNALASIIEAPALGGATAPAPTTDAPRKASKALHVDLGEWDADEVQLCEMGSHDAESAYVRVGGVSLRP